MRARIRYRPLVGLIFAGFFLFLTVGCQTGFFGVGNQVAPDKRIPFSPGGPHQGLYKANDFLLAYSYIKDGTSLQLSGTAELRGGGEGFGWLDQLFVRGYFYGADGRILDHEVLLIRGRGQSEDSWKFAKTLELPPGAKGMAFGYSGQVRGVGVDAPTWSFWGTPYP